MNITESGARLQEYIEESKEEKEMIEKEIREEKDKEIARLRKALEKIVEQEKYISDDEYLPSTAGEIAQQALKEGE